MKYYIFLFLLFLLLLDSCADNSYPMVSATVKRKSSDINSNEIITVGNNILYIYNPYKMTTLAGTFHPNGQLHCHTTNSDGTYTPSEISKYFKSVGYDFYTITDHNFVTFEPKGNELIWLWNSYEDSQGNAQHVCVYNIDEIASSFNGNLNTLIEQVVCGGNSFINYAHPDYLYLPQSDEKVIKIRDGLSFVEVWNGSMSIENNINTSCRAWDILLSKGYKVFAIAVDDMHTTSHLKKGWIEVNCEELSRNSILKNLLAGNFYAVNGIGENYANRTNIINIVNVELKDGILTITTSNTNSAKITFIGKGGAILQEESDVTSSSYSLVGDELYVRAQVQIGDMVKWIQPIFIVTKEEKVDEF